MDTPAEQAAQPQPERPTLTTDQVGAICLLAGMGARDVDNTFTRAERDRLDAARAALRAVRQAMQDDERLTITR